MANVVIVLGAGASWDASQDSGHADRSSSRPPLTSELFGNRAKEHFWNVLTHYPDAHTLYEQLWPLATSDTLVLEQALTGFKENKDENVRRQFKQLPPYISDVLYSTGVAYRLDKGRYKRLVYEILAQGEHQAAFVLLNYDVLLEESLTEHDPTLNFLTMDHYKEDDRQARVTKIHGSVNWASPFARDPDMDWMATVAQRPPEELTRNPTEVLRNRSNRISDMGTGGSWWYPTLTMPLANKTANEFVCPSSHIESLKRDLNSCERLLIAGTSAQDPDLISLLSENLPYDLQMVHIVTGEKDFKEVEHRLEQVPQIVTTLGARKVFSGGFRGYIEQGLADFAKPS